MHIGRDGLGGALGGQGHLKRVCPYPGNPGQHGVGRGLCPCWDLAWGGGQGTPKSQPLTPPELPEEGASAPSCGVPQRVRLLQPCQEGFANTAASGNRGQQGSATTAEGERSCLGGPILKRGCAHGGDTYKWQGHAHGTRSGNMHTHPVLPTRFPHRATAWHLKRSPLCHRWCPQGSGPYSPAQPKPHSQAVP